MYGMNWTLAQRLPVNIRTRMWVVPANGYLCLVSQQKAQIVGTTCDTNERTLSHGVATTFLSDESMGARRTRRIVVGVAPDRVRFVVVRTQRSVATVPVVGNVFVLRDASAVPPDNLMFK
jgi:uncharacterized membrane protein